MATLTAPFKHPSLSHAPSDLVGGEWVALPGKSGAASVESHNPARPEQVVWTGHPRAEHVDAAVRAARAAFPAWARLGKERRFAVLRRFAELCRQKAPAMADLICDETGKVMWEARGEAAALAAKVDITLDLSPTGGLRRVDGFEFDMGAAGGGGQKVGRAWFRPHGVMAVVGPFNFPAHLPNGHIIPALAMGNTVVFKPSDRAPGVGQMLVELLAEAMEKEGAPNKGKGVINLVQGGGDIASALTSHEGIDGILFTGSWPVGRRILHANIDRPSRIVALEMGGNNPVIVMEDADLRQAAIEIIRCAFNTTGQRCTCTRRVIVHARIADRLIEVLETAAAALAFGDPRGGAMGKTPTFAGPIISEAARKAVLDFQKAAFEGGAEPILESEPIAIRGGGYFLSPSIIKVEKFTADDVEPSKRPGCDREVFGPLLRIAEVRDLDEAIAQANATRYGLAASIFTRDVAAAERFMFECRAGCLNINTGTAGASSKLPFGGIGLSGNHRPAGSFSLDSCAYPVAGMIERGESAQVAEGMNWDEQWVR
ncbi:MAG: aldehyde dehydrogenase family protein [Phycisphaerales bacterium]|nr:aldehyde dehydrogenase family protein [Phycisphaerales bacterium]